MNEYIIVDRIVNEFAVCECGDERLEISLGDIITPVKEGDVLVKTEIGFVVDKDTTQKLRNNNIALQNSLWED